MRKTEGRERKRKCKYIILKPGKVSTFPKVELNYDQSQALMHSIYLL